MLLSMKKVTKDPGRCDSPRPPNAAQVWNASDATKRRNSTEFLRFSQVYRHL